MEAVSEDMAISSDALMPGAPPLRTGRLGDRASPAGGLLLSATKEMQKGHPRVAFFTFLFLAERGGFAS